MRTLNRVVVFSPYSTRTGPAGWCPLVEHSPFLSWLYPMLGVRGTADLIGIIEVSAAILIGLRRWRPDLSAVRRSTPPPRRWKRRR